MARRGHERRHAQQRRRGAAHRDAVVALRAVRESGHGATTTRERAVGAKGGVLRDGGNHRRSLGYGRSRAGRGTATRRERGTLGTRTRGDWLGWAARRGPGLFGEPGRVGPGSTAFPPVREWKRGSVVRSPAQRKRLVRPLGRAGGAPVPQGAERALTRPALQRHRGRNGVLGRPRQGLRGRRQGGRQQLVGVLERRARRREAADGTHESSGSGGSGTATGV